MISIQDFSDSMEEVKADICDNYCKWPILVVNEILYDKNGHITMSDDEMNQLMEEHCSKCPLNNL